MLKENYEVFAERRSIVVRTIEELRKSTSDSESLMDFDYDLSILNSIDRLASDFARSYAQDNQVRSNRQRVLHDSNDIEDYQFRIKSAADTRNCCFGRLLSAISYINSRCDRFYHVEKIFDDFEELGITISELRDDRSCLKYGFAEAKTAFEMFFIQYAGTVLMRKQSIA